MKGSRLTAEMLDDFVGRGRILNVCCSDHAGVRAHQRLQLPLAVAKRQVEQDVRAALAAGRFARLQPEWSVSYGYTPREQTSFERWVWNKEESVAYAIVMRRRTWVVKTVLAVSADAAAA